MVALSHLFTYFNSRPHGGRLFYRKLALRPHYFNSRPHGGRLCHFYFSGPLPVISTHALTEGDAVLPGMYRRTAHFNSRPHGGRQRQPQPLCRLYISTHALTEGDTAIFHPFSDTEISTHALTEGDSQSRTRELSRIYFNSRPHGGRRY